MRTSTLAILFLFALIIGHGLALLAFPGFILSTAYDRLLSGVGSTNTFVSRDRVTPDNQTIVRASPDLSYAVCLIDLSDGPVVVTGARSTVYGSLSIYDANTDVIFATSLRNSDEAPNATIVVKEGGPATAHNSMGKNLPVTVTPYDQAVAIIRRLGTAQDLIDGESNDCMTEVAQ